MDEISNENLTDNDAPGADDTPIAPPLKVINSGFFDSPEVRLAVHLEERHRRAAPPGCFGGSCTPRCLPPSSPKRSPVISSRSSEVGCRTKRIAGTGVKS